MAAAETVCCGAALLSAAPSGAVGGDGGARMGKWPRSGESHDGCPLQSHSSLTSIQTVGG